MATRNPTVSDSVQAHIVVTPNVAHGRPRIAGSRIRVQDVAVWHERLGMSPDEIADEYDLTLGEVHAALAYYFDNLETIRGDIERDRKFAEEYRRKNKSLVQLKLNKKRG